MTSAFPQNLNEAAPDEDLARRADLIPAAGAFNHETIAEQAYLFWLARGCPEGSPEEDWFRAEEALRLQKLPARQETASVKTPERVNVA